MNDATKKLIDDARLLAEVVKKQSVVDSCHDWADDEQIHLDTEDCLRGLADALEAESARADELVKAAVVTERNRCLGACEKARIEFAGNGGVVAVRCKELIRDEKMKPLQSCVNGCDAPLFAPSQVLCEKCFRALDEKMQSLATPDCKGCVHEHKTTCGGFPFRMNYICPVKEKP